MKSFQNSKENKEIELGRAIAQGIKEQNAQQEKNMAKAEKRQATMLERAAEKVLSGKLSR